MDSQRCNLTGRDPRSFSNQYPPLRFILLLLAVIGFHRYGRNGGAYGMADFTSKTLKTFFEHACEGQSLYLHCPVNTSLLINSAIYGRPAPNMMYQQHSTHNGDGLPKAQETAGGLRIQDICQQSPLNGSGVIKPKDKICISPHSMERVVGLCQDKQDCQIFASNSIFNDPCPNVFKYLQVSYRCQPSEFINKIACENREMVIRCERAQRIMIFFASYGIQKGGNILCRDSMKDVQIKCQATNSTEIMRSKCYGFRECRILANDSLFGNPCMEQTKLHNKYLSVVYSCVNKKVLRDGYVFEDDSSYLAAIKVDQARNKSFAKFNKTSMDSRLRNKNSFVIDLFGFYLLAKSNREKVILYFSLGCCLGLFMILIILLLRIFDNKLFNFYVLLKVCCNCCFSKASARHRKSSRTSSGKSRTIPKSKRTFQSNGNLRYNPNVGHDLAYNKFDHNYDSFSRFKLTATHPHNFDVLTSSTTSEF